MKELKLTQGFVTKVDDADYDVLKKYNWSVTINKCNVYARMAIGPRKKLVKLYLHRVILGIYDRNILCDHRDRDGLNNQRYNLRTCTKRQNSYNKSTTKSGKYIGVRKRGKKWVAYIKPNNKQLTKLLNSEIEAALWYNEQAIKYFGEFANLNKVA